MKCIKAITDGSDELYINVDRIDLVYQVKGKWKVSIANFELYITESDAKEITHQVKPRVKVDYSKEIIKVIVEFNRITGKNLDIDPVALAYSKLIDKRFQEGATLEDFIKVIQFKFDEWGDNKEMAKFVIPSTLFRPSKFTAYLQEAKNHELPITNTNTLAIF